MIDPAPEKLSRSASAASDSVPSDTLGADAMLRLLNRLVVRLAAVRDLDDAMGAILDALLLIPPIHAGGIYVTDESTGGLRLAMHRGLPESFVKAVERYPADSPNTLLVRAGQPVYATYDALLRSIGATRSETEPLHALGVIPILHEGLAIGALNVASYTAEQIPDEVRASLESFGAHVSGALARVFAQRVAEQERQNLATFFATTEDLLFVVATDGTLLHCNPCVERRLGYSLAELRGQPVLMVHPPSTHAEAVRVIGGFVTGKISLCRLPLQARDGTIIPVETRGALGRWEGREVVFGVSRDLTERRRLEAQLQQAQKMEALGALAGGIAHDFNNLVGAMMVCSEGALQAIEIGEDPSDELRDILDAAKQARELTTRILSFARKKSPVLSVVEVCELVSSTVGIVGRTLPRTIHVQLDVCSGELYAHVDRSALATALLNLAANARDAMPDGGTLRFGVARRAVSISDDTPADAPSEVAHIYVSDSGHGMDEATVMRVFEPFFTTKDDGKGTGLGLAMVYAMARDAGGEVRCRSKMGSGTTFDIYLPLAPHPGST